MTEQKKLTRKDKFSNAPIKKENVAAIDNSNSISKYFIWIVAIFAAVLYLNTANFDYALDDYASIIENRSTQKGDLKEIFKTSYRYGAYMASDELYRPIPKSLFAIQWSLSPNNAHLGHWTNIFLYSILAIIVFNFCKRILKGDLLFSFLATLLFISFPIHTEAVANIKSVDEILSMLFGFLALNKFCDYLQNKKTSYVVFSILFFVASLLCKESSITLLAILPLLIYYFAENKFKAYSLALLSFVGVTILYFVLRSNVYGLVPIGTLPSSSDNLLVKAIGSIERYTSAIYFMGLYLIRIVWPFGLTFDASFPQLSLVGIGSSEFLISFVVLLLLLLATIYGVVKKELYGFALMFFFITASVSSNIFTLIGTQYGERLMFMPSLGIALASVVLLSKVQFKQMSSVIIALCLIYGFITIQRNAVWENNETLYRSGLITAPNSARTNYYMGNFLVKENQISGKSDSEQKKIINEGITYLKKSAELTPYFSDAWDQMGLAYMRIKDFDSSRYAFVNALNYGSNDPKINNNYGNLLFNTNQIDSALVYFEKAVSLKPDYTDALNNIGSVYGNKGDFQKALVYFEKSYAVNPNSMMTNRFLGLTWNNLGNQVLGQQFLQRAEALNKSN
jgi:tetratricopeptide (TPR) repeat protein